MAESKATLWLKVKTEGEKALESIGDKLGSLFSITTIVASGFAALTAALVKGFFEFKEQEEAVNELNQSMINAGTYTSDLQNKYLNLASALSKVTVYTDDQITRAQSLLQAHIGNREVTEDLLKATLNLASAKKLDLATAADMVGKTIGGETNALKKANIEIDGLVGSHEKLGAVVKAIDAKYKDYATTQAQGTNSVVLLKNASMEFLEVLGERIAPAVNKAAQTMTEWINKMTDGVSTNSLMKKSYSELSQEVLAHRRAIIDSENRISALRATGAKEVEGEIAQHEQKIKAEEEAIAKIKAIRDKGRADEATAQANAAENSKKLKAENHVRDLETEILAIEAKAAVVNAKEEELGLVGVQNALKIQNARLAQAQTAIEKERIMQTIANLKTVELEEIKNQKLIKDRGTFLGQLAGLQNSSNSTLATLGKAAAIFQIQLEGHKAAASALAWGTSLGGPPLGKVFELISYAATAAQIASVAGLQLAQGGVVMPRPGGVQATIAEAGQAEAVIPLDKFPGLGGGTTIQIVVNGGLLGDQSSAYEFAKAVDRELLKLRQNNESQAFDGIIV